MLGIMPDLSNSLQGSSAHQQRVVAAEGGRLQVPQHVVVRLWAGGPGRRALDHKGVARHRPRFRARADEVLARASAVAMVDQFVDYVLVVREHLAKSRHATCKARDTPRRQCFSTGRR